MDYAGGAAGDAAIVAGGIVTQSTGILGGALLDLGYGVGGAQSSLGGPSRSRRGTLSSGSGPGFGVRFGGSSLMSGSTTTDQDDDQSEHRHHRRHHHGHRSHRPAPYPNSGSPITASNMSSGASTGSSGSDLGIDFFAEPDLAMSRANWWGDLVRVYSPDDAEVGTGLVMSDITHL